MGLVCARPSTAQFESLNDDIHRANAATDTSASYHSLTPLHTPAKSGGRDAGTVPAAPVAPNSASRPALPAATGAPPLAAAIVLYHSMLLLLRRLLSRDSWSCRDACRCCLPLRNNR